MIRLALFAICLFLIGCSPCHRIQRLSTKHPECFKSMTETKTDTGGLKVADRDSSKAKADDALKGLSDTITKYITIIQDCSTPKEQKERAISKIKDQLPGVRKVIDKAIDDAPCINDTITYTDSKGAILKLWQVGDQIKYSLLYSTQVQKLSTEGWPWWVWLLIGIGGTIGVFAVMRVIAG
jgi:hypothetical protein